TAGDYEEIRSLLARRPFSAEAEEEIRRTVEDILSRVRQEGDKALVDYTKAFDGVDLTTAGIKVKEEELQAARAQVAPEFLTALHTAKENILRYHRQQVSRSWTLYEEGGILLGQRYLPLDSVGLYVPGGTGG